MGPCKSKAQADKTSQPSSASGRQPTSNRGNESQAQVVMGKYRMFMGTDDIMGEGSSSICRRGEVIDSKEPVAIKVYKEKKEKTNTKTNEVKMQKFKRQIKVLQELLVDFKKPSNGRLWHELLEKTEPANLFMKLIDYSKDSSQEPGPDKDDGVLYVVTELAQYSMKDFLASRREQNKKISMDEVKSIAQAMLLVLAGLHAKGLVHIDFKPENMMMFGGRLKLIDVDGCVKVGTEVSIQDSTISFSPCYCAPEWARFLINEGETSITISSALDVWSVGMTLCELVTLDAVLKPMYTNFLRNAHSHREAGFLFMDWLSSMKKMQLPRTIGKFDPRFADLLTTWLLVCDASNRKSCAETLKHDFLKGAKALAPEKQAPARNLRMRSRDQDDQQPLKKGVLFKLDATGDPKNQEHWRRRDMWIAANGSLCYYSQKDKMRLVLIDGSKLHAQDAKVEKFTDGVMKSAFKIQIRAEDETTMTTYCFACEAESEVAPWMKCIRALAIDMPTVALNSKYATDCRRFILSVRNRRQKITENDEAFEPQFQGKLFKLKTEGDAMKPEDWFERDMWIAKNGSFVYYSPKEDRPLIYYTQADMLQATVQKLDEREAKACKPLIFQIALPACDGIEFAPGVFAAPSKEDLANWIAKIAELKK